MALEMAREPDGEMADRALDFTSSCGMAAAFRKAVTGWTEPAAVKGPVNVFAAGTALMKMGYAVLTESPILSGLRMAPV